MNRFQNVVLAVLSLFLSVCVLVSPASTEAYQVPSYDGLVNDYADVLSDQFEANLEYQLESLAVASDGAEIALVTITDLDGDTVENVAQDFFDTWKLGKDAQDNGLLLLVAVDDRQLRIHTGYGTETVITDSIAGRIIRDDITPFFKENNYEAGIQQGINTITDYLQDPSLIPAATSPETETVFSTFRIVALLYFVMVFGIGGISYVVAFLGRSKAIWPGGAVGFILGLFIGKIPGAVAFGLFGLLLDYILSKNYTNWKLEKKATDWKKTWGGFSSGSGSRSSGGFSSFGGGSSGGGGTSGRW